MPLRNNRLIRRSNYGVEMSESKRNRYHVVLDTEPDKYLAQVIQMHGPYETPGEFVDHTVDKCLACNVIWPCTTFRVFEDRMVQTAECSATRNYCGAEHYCHKIGPHVAHICANDRCTFIWED